MASIQFVRGKNEDTIPDVRLTRSRDGSNGKATFYFEKPKSLFESVNEEITGMYLQDEEGEIVTYEVAAKFINGQPAGLEAVYIMKSEDAWDRFMRFMERYAEEHGLGFTKSS
jgi:photosystem II protein